jgi:hypothetical protein
MTGRWTFDDARNTIAQCGPTTNLHRVPGTIEAVLAEVLPGVPWSARWWYPIVMGTTGICSGDNSVYGSITVTVPDSVDRAALCLRLKAAVSNVMRGATPDIEVVW